MQILLSLKKQAEVFCKPKIFSCLEKQQCLELKLLHKYLQFYPGTASLEFTSIHHVQFSSSDSFKNSLQGLISLSWLCRVSVGGTEESCAGSQTRLPSTSSCLPVFPLRVSTALRALEQASSASVKVKMFSPPASSTLEGLRYFRLLRVLLLWKPLGTSDINMARTDVT